MAALTFRERRRNRPVLPAERRDRGESPTVTAASDLSPELTGR